jgi:threonine/homoserine/homoserine lactone efflux protein
MALLLSAANPKIVVLAAAGGLAIGADVVGAGEQLVSVLVFALVGSISVAIPVLGFLILGDRVLTPLGVARDWLERHNSAVMAVVFIVIGLVLALKGARAL